MTSTIADLAALEVLDSRGRPTVSATVTLADGSRHAGSVPSGASTGLHEAHELRDGGRRYGGLGVRRAVASVEGELRSALVGSSVADQESLDRAMVELDGTADKSRLGANAILAVSLAAARAAAAAADQPLYQHLAAGGVVSMPMPMTNMISGGMHARGAMDIQDVLVVPVGAGTYSQALEWICDVFRSLGLVLESQGQLPSGVADEGGYGLAVPACTALELTTRAISEAGHRPGEDIAIALDMAASRLIEGDRYRIDGDLHTAEQVVDRVEGWLAEFPIVSVEDILHEDDWQGWELATRRLDEIQLVGDDLFATNPVRLASGIERRVANSVLVKVNQIGTLSEARRTVAAARGHGYATVVSARSGETEDTFLADLAVGVDGGQIKVGSITRSERLAKYNRLLEIERELGPGAVLAHPLAAGARA